MSKPRLIAFYLPQFYPTKENDEWWGNGFTEWTNVGRAKPLFHGHYQPRVPADLGYYDLRIPEVRMKQAEMAKNAKIEGFCYWHYWFGGTRLLDRVFNEVVESHSPNYPFCLCWANHSWYKKIWDPTQPDKLLIEQTYPGKEDYIAHFNAMLPAFKDPRYMKVNGKLIFAVYLGMDIPDKNLFFTTWNCLAKQNGLDGFYFIGMTENQDEIETLMQDGYDAVAYDGIRIHYKDVSPVAKLMWRIIYKFTNIPKLLKYDKYTDLFCKHYKVKDNVHPIIYPNFDHSPRSSNRGVIIPDSTPKKWKKFCLKMFHVLAHRNAESNFVFIKAWNEWGEGNYLEPDLKYGRQYLNATKEAWEESDK